MEYLPDFEFVRPETPEAIVAARQANPAARLLGGGTDLIPNMRRGLIETDTVIDVSRVEEMRILTADGEGLKIGASITLEALGEWDRLDSTFRAIGEAARSVAGPIQRAMATVGGNLCLDTRCIFYNQSEWWRVSIDYCLKYRGEICHVVPTSKRCYASYSGDLAAAFLVFDAEVEIAGSAGRRRMPLAELFEDDGIDYLALGADEVLVAVHVPARWQELRSSYHKIRVRDSIDFPLAGVAVGAAAMANGAVETLRIGLTGTNSRPMLLDATAEFVGLAFGDEQSARIEKLVQKQISPVRTTLIQPQYRRRAISARTARVVREIFRPA